jgi:CyaY protein
MSTETLPEREFDQVADKTLRAILDALSTLEDDRFEVDLQMGVMTLEFQDGLKYVINSHRAARQIWMAAERSAWHFDYVPADGRWVASKSGDELWSAVEAVLSRKLGVTVSLPRGGGAS